MNPTDSKILQQVTREYNLKLLQLHQSLNNMNEAMKKFSAAVETNILNINRRLASLEEKMAPQQDPNLQSGSDGNTEDSGGEPRIINFPGSSV